jgi:signal transduction histidine kinase
MKRIERSTLLILILLAAAELADLLFDYQLFWSHAKSFDQTDLSLHILILLLVTTALVSTLWMRSQRQQSDLALSHALDRAGAEQARTDSILAALGDGVSIQDLDYRVIYQNDRHRELAGRDALGQYCYQAYSREENVCKDCPVEKTFRDGHIHRLSKALSPEHEASHIEIISSPLYNAAGEIVAGIELVRDISRHQQREAKVADLNRELNEQAELLKVVNRELEAFSYSLAHDLRSQLTPMLLGAEALLNSYRAQLDEHGRLFVDTIITSGEKIEQVVDGMLVLGRVRSEKMVWKDVDLSALAGEIMESLARSAPERKVSWVIASSLRAWGDMRLLRIALQNLLANAWKYSARNETADISFGVISGHDESCFFVRDNGVGFDQSKVGHLFQPFSRLHGEEFDGSGVGLATVARIIERHNGWIRAESKEGEGASFYFTLPQKS